MAIKEGPVTMPNDGLAVASPKAVPKWSMGLQGWSFVATNITAVSMVCFMFYQNIQDMRYLVKEELRSIRSEAQDGQQLIRDLTKSVDRLTGEITKTRDLFSPIMEKNK